MMKSIATILLVLTATLLIASPAQARYADGLNQYAAYHVMRGGVDPSGLTSVSIDLSCERAEECICKNIEIEIIDKNWAVYPYEGGSRLGARIKTTFKVEGDITKCKYYQDESGPGDLKIAKLRSRYVRDNGQGSQWSDNLRGKNNPIEEVNGFSKWDQEAQTVTYTDPMGTTYDPPNQGRINLQVQVILHARMRCVSSTGDKLERDFKWGGEEGVQGTTKRDAEGNFTTSGDDPKPTVGELQGGGDS